MKTKCQGTSGKWQVADALRGAVGCVLLWAFLAGWATVACWRRWRGLPPVESEELS